MKAEIITRTIGEAELVSGAIDVVQPNLSRSLSHASLVVHSATGATTQHPAHDGRHVVVSLNASTATGKDQSECGREV